MYQFISICVCVQPKLFRYNSGFMKNNSHDALSKWIVNLLQQGMGHF